MARAAYLAFMVVVGLFAAMMATVFFSGFTYFLAPVGAESEDPSTQPLEVVAAPDSCVLNVREVAPGTHEVVVVAEQAGFRVLIRDPSGKVVFVGVTRPGSEPVTPRTVPLGVGTYRVECRGGGGTHLAELLVVEGS